ncbi:hypothetical protein NL676_025040 [Syzygium grande]|nr:hypothetical protein NL676_025040 [Syzygium grande]
MCEKEAAYFHKRCSHKPMDKECGTKRKLGDSAVEAMHTPVPHDVKRSLIEDTSMDKTVTVADCNILSQPKASKTLIEVGPSGKLRNKKKAAPKKKLSVAFDCLEEKPDSTPKSLFIGSRGSPVYLSNRRPITEEEESSAFRLARAAASSDSFLIVMRPTHVYKRFYLSIPTDWATANMDRRNQDLILRVGEGTWHARYRLTGRGSGGLSSGWKNFALENNLEQSDVCLFNLANNIDKNIILDVTIFRVVEDVVPLTLSQQSQTTAGKWPLFGHLHLLAGPKLPHEALCELADKCGPIFRICVGPHLALVVCSREAANECFTVHDVAVSLLPKLMSGKLLGNDYANFGSAPYGAYWSEMWKVTALELLSNSQLQLLSHIRESEMEIWLKAMYRVESKPEDVFFFFFGKDKPEDVDADTINKATTMSLVAGGTDTTAVTLTWALALLLNNPLAIKRAQAELDIHLTLASFLHGFDLRTAQGNGAVDMTAVAGLTIDKATPLEVMTLVAGGTDTTAVTLIWALALLLNNPLTIKRAQAELDVHVGRDRLVKESDLSNLVYVQNIVKETLRLYPAGPLSGMREFTQDCTIKGYRVPAGTRLITNLWKLQRDPCVWERPDEFEPERFLAGAHKDVDMKGQHFELIPFGAGRRACPGANFGVQMAQLTLASLLHGFDVRTAQDDGVVDMTAVAGLTIGKATPLQVMVRPRLSPSAYEGFGSSVN